MKKTKLLLLTLATTVLTSCANANLQGDTDPQEQINQDMMGGIGGMQVVNPIKTYNSSEDLTAVLGFTVIAVPQAENITYSTISNELAQVKFTVNGIDCTLRANNVGGDFSGVYIPVESEKPVEVLLNGSQTEALHKKLTDGTNLISWANSQNSVYYSLYIEGNPENLIDIINSAVSINCSEVQDVNGTIKDANFKWNCIRTDAMSYEGETQFPYAVMISSKNELDNYYNENKENFYLERIEKVYSDTTIGFLDEADKYDESFFEENALILIVTENGSGSVTHNVKNVEVSDIRTVITIKNNIPEICTDDMANWHIFISVPKAELISDNIEITWEK